MANHNLTIDERVLQGCVPTYLLDLNYHFIDWNWMFDELIAIPFKLKRLQHATDLIRELDNRRECLERSARVFAVDKVPAFDFEPLEFTIPAFGKVHFRKVAFMIFGPQGDPEYWVVQFNIDHAENPDLLWATIEKRFDRELSQRRSPTPPSPKGGG